MSTSKVERTGWLDNLFPERHWDELTRDKYDEVFEMLRVNGGIEEEIGKFIRERKIRIGFFRQYKSGGGWTLRKNITLKPGDNIKTPYVLSLIIHETFHLKQSLWMRLSMQGELRAWQYQQESFRKLYAKGIGEAGQAYPGTQIHWDRLATLSSESRKDLAEAQGLMKKISPGYRSDCLPLFPLGKEFFFHVKQGKIGEAFKVIGRLIHCK